MKLIIATSQFPVSHDIEKNFTLISKQMVSAKKNGAELVHFPEAALSGYAGVDFTSFKNFPWEKLHTCTEKILKLAQKLSLWVILGSAHRLTGTHKPHNSLYIIDKKGEIINRYDKMFCAGDRKESSGDLAYYTSGNYFCIFEIRGIPCGVLICHDFRYPELYMEYKRAGVKLMFHSYNAGNIDQKRFREMQKYVGKKFHRINHGSTIPEITMAATMQSYAANNYLWISCSNTSAKESLWPAFFVRPDGVKTGQLVKNRTGLLITKINSEKEYYDSTVAWRENAMNGVFHSGTIVKDQKSLNRTTI